MVYLNVLFTLFFIFIILSLGTINTTLKWSAGKILEKQDKQNELLEQILTKLEENERK